jgi:hypothetical protein
LVVLAALAEEEASVAEASVAALAVAHLVAVAVAHAGKKNAN